MQRSPIRANADPPFDSNDSVAARYLGGKRAACDRCRGQKLRCPRDGQDGLSDSVECARCAKVGAVCSFGTSKRAGRPSNSKFKVSAESNEHRNAERTTSSATTAIQEAGEFTVFDVTRPEDRTFETPPFASTMPGVEEGMTPFFNAQYPFTFGPFDGDFGWPIPPPLGIGSNPLCMSSGGPRPGPGLPASTSSAPCAAPAISKIRKAAQARANSGDKMEWEGSDRLQIKIPQSPLPSSVGYSNHGSSPALAQDVRHRRMQELSELGMTVYAQVMENDCRDETDPFSLSSPHDLAGKVLESSIKFLNLLTSSYTSHTAPLSASKNVCAAWSDDDIASTPEALEFNSTSTDEGGTNHSDKHRRQRKHSGSSNDVDINPSPATSDTNPQPADVTEVFALLTCYIRILHLHSLLYSRLSLSLAPSLQKTSNNAPPPPLFPGLCIGAVSLDRFAKFQIKLLLQISVHLLGEIEKVLGLPERYRISKKQNEDQGIFDGAVSAQFIEMTMEEKGMVGGVGAGGGDKEDRFRSITDSLVRLRKMLKGSIDP